MNEELLKLIADVGANFGKAKATELSSKEYAWSDNSNPKTVFGDTMCWNNTNLVWVLNSVSDGSYEGYGAQIGIDQKGRLMYEYQSHCSCDGFNDSSGDGDGEVMPAITTKTYEVSSLPKDWEKIVQVNCEKILAAITPSHE